MRVCRPSFPGVSRTSPQVGPPLETFQPIGHVQSAVGQTAHSVIGCSGSESGHEKRNGSDESKQTLKDKKTHTEMALHVFHLTSQIFHSMAIWTEEIEEQLIAMLPVFPCFSVNTDYRCLLVWRGITSHACAERMSLVCRWVSFLRCVQGARPGPTQATQGDTAVGRQRATSGWCVLGLRERVEYVAHVPCQ